MSAAPTIYAPTEVKWRIGFKQGRQWDTVVNSGPTHRRQSFSRLVRPQRLLTATVYASTVDGSITSSSPFGNNDPGNPSGPKLTADHIFAIHIRPFLDQIKGRRTPFYIFDPVPRAYFNLRVGGWNGSGLPKPILWPDDLPFVFPFRSYNPGLASPTVADVKELILVNVSGGPALVYDADELVLTDNGPGLETRIDDIAPHFSHDPPDPAYYYAYVSVDATHERIPVVRTSDLDDFNFDWNQATPPPEITLQLEEYFG